MRPGIANDAPAVGDAIDQAQAPAAVVVARPHHHPHAGATVDDLDANEGVGDQRSDPDPPAAPYPGVSDAVRHQLAGEQHHRLPLGALEAQVAKLGPSRRRRLYIWREGQIHHRHPDPRTPFEESRERRVPTNTGYDTQDEGTVNPCSPAT